jgi:8-oxo-dGTP pyrophosphatase MutT (NUDIX family)
MFGVSAPPSLEAAQAASGMDITRTFSPGQPLNPFEGYSRTPRAQDYQTGYNIAARPRRNERVSFDTLRGLVDAYDVAQMCIWHRIDSVRSLDWTLVAADGVEGDVGKWVEIGKSCLERPDRVLPFHSWIAKYAYDILAFDAGALYRIRNNAGQVIGLEVVDGTTIAPLLDFWGRTPRADRAGDEQPPAYVQFANGLPFNWLTLDDLIYVPFRPVSNSPYGRSPLETVMLNANTDLRFQMYFLQRFTDGNIPAAFASAPETWNPTQIEEFQQYWDAFMMGDQSSKSQVKWMPGGGKIEWSNEKEFSDVFSLFLMRKTAAAYHVTPADLGFTEDVNKSSGETQVDVQFRVGDLPLIQHIQGLLTSFLQDDLHLPLEFSFDTGQEKEDRLATAQADAIYIQNAVISSSEVRQRVYGLEEPNGVPVPRYVFSTRAGPIPLSALYAVAGPVDPDSGAPLPGSELPHKPFALVEGVAPQKPPSALPLAVERYPDENAASVQAAVAADSAAVVKELTSGITSGTGIVGNPMIDEDEEEQGAPLVVKVDPTALELASFRRFAKARARAGRWRDFEFTTTDDTTAHRLNDSGRAHVRKAAGELVAAGLCVRAADTGRVLMLQRAFDPADPASGMWEFPGGHIEDGETAFQAARREWQEETGCLIPADATVGNVWASSNGVYQGCIVTVPSEAVVPIHARGSVINPDDPDGDSFEAIAWWNPALLDGNPAVRADLAADLQSVLAALAPTEVVKSDPKVSWRDGAAKTPQHSFDLQLTDHYAPKITDALHAAFPAGRLRAAIETTAGTVAKASPTKPDDPAKDLLREAAKNALAGADRTHLEAVLRQLVAESYQTGAFASSQQLGAGAVTPQGVDAIDWSTWQPGDLGSALTASDGGLAQLLNSAGVTIDGITGSLTDQLGNTIADGLLSGDSVDTIAGSLGDIVDDPSRAEMIAHTETCRAQTQASLDTYGLNGIGAWDWVLSDGACPECEDAASANPYPVGNEGDQPPQHPRCRCSVSPVVPTG